jgi:hypothetical protein
LQKSKDIFFICKIITSFVVWNFSIKFFFFRCPIRKLGECFAVRKTH